MPGLSSYLEPFLTRISYTLDSPTARIVAHAELFGWPMSVIRDAGGMKTAQRGAMIHLGYN
jgi:hypothetical protein